VDWVKSDNAEIWTATGRTGTQWDIVSTGRGYGVIVANWNNPDWYAPTLDEAKQIAEERDAAPPIPPDQWVAEPVGDDSWMSREPPRYVDAADSDKPPAADS
jgi:hypothetical protein